jgi:hypothetical protein
VTLPLFPPPLFTSRFAADPAGCFVAVDRDDPGALAGALFPWRAEHSDGLARWRSRTPLRAEVWAWHWWRRVLGPGARAVCA